MCLRIAAVALISIDLGPNLSVTGALAAILWLAVRRREGLRRYKRFWSTSHAGIH